MTSPRSRNRCSGFFAVMVRMIAESSFGTRWAIVSGGGSARFAPWSALRSPCGPRTAVARSRGRKACSPKSDVGAGIDSRSIRACSGAMKAGVPIATLAIVIWLDPTAAAHSAALTPPVDAAPPPSAWVAAIFSSASATSGVFTRPRSATLTTP